MAIRPPRRAGVALVLSVAAALASAVPARAAELRREQTVQVAASETITDDVYAFGEEVRVDGRIEGDLIAFARIVRVEGEVTGDLVAAAQQVQVTGEVGGSIRAAGQKIVVDGEVGRDLIAAGGALETRAGGAVADDVWLAGGEATLAGPVGGALRIAGGRASLAGPVAGDVDARVGELSLSETAHVGGSLSYEASEAASISPGATVEGGIIPSIVEKKPAAILLTAVWLWIRAVFGLTALGLLFALLTPRLAKAAPAALTAQPWRALGVGALAFFGVPAVLLLVLLVGVVTGGWWIALFGAAAFAIALTLCFPVMGLWLGRAVLHRDLRWPGEIVLTLLVGVALVAAAVAIPVLGAVIAFATLLFGLGALCLGALEVRRGAPGTFVTARP